MKKYSAVIIFIIILLGLGYWFTRPVFFVQGEKGLITEIEAYDGLPLQIDFIHSVQKTPVEERLHLSDDLKTIKLDSTIYHSFGVGLPFLAEEGDWHQEGNDFIIDNMNRNFPKLSLRTGVGTKLTLTVDNEVFPVYESVPPGYRIDIYVAPRYQKYLDR